MHPKILIIALILCSYFACTKKETIYLNDHDNVIEEGNVAPPYAGITIVQIQNYINKLYIDLLGREPNLQELEDAANFLKSSELTMEARSTVVNELLEQPAYYNRLWEIYRRDYLNGVTDEDINDQLGAFQFFYNDISQNTDPQSQAFASLILLEIEKLNLLVAAREDYANGNMGINDLMHRIAFNAIYDEINMGAENMVLSCFENFLKRKPTEAELVAGVTMVDSNQGATLLLQDGNNKFDFVTIITATPEFYQGLTFDAYQQLLVREPTSAEMTAGTESLLTNKNFQLLQLEVAISDEYAGF
jgi:hypothetical protein